MSRFELPGIMLDPGSSTESETCNCQDNLGLESVGPLITKGCHYWVLASTGRIQYLNAQF